MSNGNSTRPEFLMEMYRVYWANIARSMEGVWKVLAPITVAGTILAGVHKDYLPASFGISLALVVILWALNVTIDLNAWHRRNLLFVAKAEQEFLAEKDYGRILPAAYRVPSAGWITFYTINAVTFVAFLILSALYAAIWELRDVGFVEGWLLPCIVLGGGLIATGLNAWAQERSARGHRDELFGKAATTETSASEAGDAR